MWFSFFLSSPLLWMFRCVLYVVLTILFGLLSLASNLHFLQNKDFLLENFFSSCVLSMLVLTWAGRGKNSKFHVLKWASSKRQSHESSQQQARRRRISWRSRKNGSCKNESCEAWEKKKKVWHLEDLMRRYERLRVFLRAAALRHFHFFSLSHSTSLLTLLILSLAVISTAKARKKNHGNTWLAHPQETPFMYQV